mmetsp:Transcript_8360/g.52121  ORF Transcript_8360/g.52121 Transcript_8360/m.52121 type:complete len:413 (+) Transcript_8360:2261-3499(+)
MTACQSTTDGMPNFVVGHEAFGLAISHGGTLHTSNNSVNTVIDFLLSNSFLVTASSENGSFVQQIGQVSSTETRRAQGDGLNADAFLKFLVAGMHSKDLLAAPHIWDIYSDLSVKATRPQQRIVQNVDPVRGSDDNDSSVPLKTIHLCQQLVQGLFPFVIATTNTSTARSAYGIDLINENNTRRILFCFLEQVTHTRCTHTHKHLHKFRTTDAEERHACLSSDGFGQQGLPRSRWTYKKYTLWNSGAHCSEAFWTFEELHDFHEVLLGLVHTSNVRKRDSSVGFHLELGLGLSKRQRVTRTSWTTHAPLVPPRKKEQASHQEQGEGQVSQEVEEDGSTVLLLGVRRKVHVLITELLQQFGGRAWELHTHPLHAVSQFWADGFHDGDGSVFVQVHLFHPSHVQVFQEPRVRHA